MKTVSKSVGSPHSTARRNCAITFPRASGGKGSVKYRPTHSALDIPEARSAAAFTCTNRPSTSCRLAGTTRLSTSQRSTSCKRLGTVLHILDQPRRQVRAKRRSALRARSKQRTASGSSTNTASNNGTTHPGGRTLSVTTRLVCAIVDIILRRETSLVAQSTNRPHDRFPNIGGGPRDPPV